VGEIRKYGVPTWCRGVTPKTGKCRIEAMEINGPVVLAGIRINPGDLLIADGSGICAIPPQHAEFVLKKCREKSIIAVFLPAVRHSAYYKFVISPYQTDIFRKRNRLL